MHGSYPTCRIFEPNLDDAHSLAARIASGHNLHFPCKLSPAVSEDEEDHVHIFTGEVVVKKITKSRLGLR